MKLTHVAVASIAILCSCTVHLHIHEAPAQGSPHVTSQGVDSHTIAGVVVDERGEPTKAQVAVVGATGGSRSMSTPHSGVFHFGELESQEYVVTATNPDGRIAVLPHVRPGGRIQVPPLSAGATVTIEILGRPSARLGVIHEGVRVHDFTVRSGKPAIFVIPAGDVRLLIYGKNLNEDHSLTVVAGDSRTLQFDIGS